ncbi:MAG TPA: VacJ family lipoprotein [Verrucomicrobiae bacterium]|nr:VacJ family lipoprotein [Verrucomicrobiae bacterium]
MGHWGRRSLSWLGELAVAVIIVGLVGASSAMAEDPQSTGAVAAQQVEGAVMLETEQIEEYDPWEPYNEKIFDFNHNVFDRYVLKPVATTWDYLPDPVQESLGNAFDNIAMPRRVVNNLLQAKFKGAGTELARFGINTTVGIVGLFDVAKTYGLEKSDADTGQTMGIWGVGPGPYLILPFLPPLTARDAFGFAADVAMDPLNYLIPFAALAGRGTGDVVNTRSQNLELFESVEESTVDLYSAVRNGYLQRRHRAIAK